MIGFKDRQMGIAHSKRWILAALMLTMSLAAMDTTIVSTAIPEIVGDLGGFASFSWVFSIYLLAQTVTIPIYGKLADMKGRKPVLLWGIIVFLLGSATSGFAWNMLALIIFRGLQGLGAGSIMASVNTLAADLYDIRERARVQGWLSSVWGIAAIVGPAMGGALVEYASWRWIFFINLPIGLLALFLLIVFLHEQKPARKHRIDIPGAVLIFLSASLLILALLEGGQVWPWISLAGIGFLVLAFLLMFVVYVVERRAQEPIMPIWVWKHRTIAGSNLSMILMGTIMMGPSMFLPLYVQSALAGSAMLAGFILASSSIGWPAASAYSGRLYLSIGFRNAAWIGAVLICCSALLFLFLPFPATHKQITIHTAHTWLLFADQILLGAGFGLLSTPLLVGVQSMVPWQQRGVVTGNNIFSRYLGQTVGAALMGGIFNRSLHHYAFQNINQIPSSLRNEFDTLLHHLLQGHVPANLLHGLRKSLYMATCSVYGVMALLAFIIIVVLLFTPAHFPVLDENVAREGTTPTP